mmetsp:Transcript_6719/g.11035  ORF Transcript_6719/g.11035 Transcript_6719/m.11035 type:complete len:102 (-) Transcript_6719:1393-1698(-)
MLWLLTICVATAREEIIPEERFKKLVGLGLVTFLGLSRHFLVDEAPGDDVTEGATGLALGFEEASTGWNDAVEREVPLLLNCFLTCIGAGRVPTADIDLFT